MFMDKPKILMVIFLNSHNNKFHKIHMSMNKPQNLMILFLNSHNKFLKKQLWHKFLGKHWAALVILAYLHYNYLTKVHTANPINLDVVCAQWSHFFLEPNFFWKQYKFLLWAHRYDTNSKLGKTWIISKFDKGCKHFSFDIACT